MISLIQECNITGSFQEQRLESKYRMEILRNYLNLLQNHMKYHHRTYFSLQKISRDEIGYCSWMSDNLWGFLIFMDNFCFFVVAVMYLKQLVRKCVLWLRGPVIPQSYYTECSYEHTLLHAMKIKQHLSLQSQYKTGFTRLQGFYFGPLGGSGASCRKNIIPESQLKASQK